VVVNSAAKQDRVGAKILLEKVKGVYSRLEKIYADCGYNGKFIDWVKDSIGIKCEIVKPKSKEKGFELRPFCWIVERTFAWLKHYRRLSKDYERKSVTSESLVYASMVRLMLKRLERMNAM